MSTTMVLEEIRIRDFRNLEAVDLEPGPGLNVLHGINGQGKTAFLEAIHFLAEGRSFRGVRASGLVRNGTGALNVRARIRCGTLVEGAEPAAHEHLEAGWSSAGRRLVRNGNDARGLAEYWGALRVVVHEPEDSRLVAGPPEGRRRFLNRILALTRPGLYRVLVDFTKVVRNRNHCLRAGAGAAELEAWTEPFLRLGSQIRAERLRLVRELHPRVQELYARLSGRDDLEAELSYRTGAGATIEGAERDAAARELADELARKAERERRWGRTVVGPHLDELKVRLASGVARTHASQGERRTVLIALRFAERDLIARATREDPVFLVDDLSSELDATRTERVLGEVEGLGGQVFLTGTEPRPGARRARSFHVEAGVIRADDESRGDDSRAGAGPPLRAVGGHDA